MGQQFMAMLTPRATVEAGRRIPVPPVFAACMFLQWRLGRHTFAEQHLASATFKEPPLQYVKALPGFAITLLDQCAHGAEHGGVPIRKASHTLAKFQMPSVARRCTQDHIHKVLNGSRRTTPASAWPQPLCTSVLRDWLATRFPTMGGRSFEHV